MFFLTYLRRELRRRLHQSVFIALGMAVGIGLVVTVTAASSGVKKAQAGMLRSLYGVGTDVTVTGKPPASQEGDAHGGGLNTLNGESIGMGATGPQICKNGTCRSAAGQAVELLTAGTSKPFGQSAVASVAKLRHVTAADGGLVLTDNQVTIPANGGEPQVNTVSLNGVDLYVTAASAANVSAVDTEIGRLLTGYPVTTASGLASQVTGSLSSAAKLANDLGR